MKFYIQFKTLSTGYPEFTEESKKPIDLLGSDGVCILDGRLNIESMIYYAYEKISNHISKRSIIGFDIIRANSFLDKGNIRYSKLIKK
jgi:hypothetical protein